MISALFYHLALTSISDEESPRLNLGDWLARVTHATDHDNRTVADLSNIEVSTAAR